MELDRIYNEDCLEGMKRIDDGAVDCIITDLPYGTTACAWDSVIPFEPLWEQFKRVAKPNAAIVLFGSEPFSSALRMSNIGMWRYDWIWEKTKAPNWLMLNMQPMRLHEVISVFYQKLPTYNPQMRKGEPYSDKRTERVCPRGDDIGTLKGQKKMVPRENDGTRYPKDVIKFSNVNSGETFHPTQKPVDLLRYLILTYSNEGDTILDATIGSGTTAVAALMEKRHFIGFETNKEYFDIAQGRIDQVLRNPTLF